MSQITLLTGANSSGKSSLLNSILSAFQTNQFPSYLSPNGKYINMGDFEEISFNHLPDNKIGLDIYLDDDSRTSFKTNWVINKRNKMPELYNLDIKKQRYGKNNVLLNLKLRKTDDNYYLSDFNVEPSRRDVKGLKVKDIKVKDINVNEITRELREKNNHSSRILGRRPINMKLNRYNSRLSFISSFRFKPERTYYQKAKADDRIGSSGEDYLSQISEWEDRESPEFVELNSILKKLNLAHAIKIKQLAGGRFELRVQVKDGGVWSSLADIGFGISQVLPVLVADLQLPLLRTRIVPTTLWVEGIIPISVVGVEQITPTLLVEQPAIHLHPSVQASLADYFIEKINANDKQYIIETHSEYLLNRIRLAIVKGELEPSDLSVYYFENLTDSGTVTHKIEFATDGQIHNAPQGFFETYMVDAMEIVLHI